MKLVIIESPYAGDIEKFTHYARLCMKDSINRGEAPIASHLIYTQPHILDENNKEERELGINIGYEWARRSELIAFYVDYGMSPGMKKAYEIFSSHEFDYLEFDKREIF